MEVIRTDLLIIGGGPGGYVAAIYAAKKGLEVTLVDGKRIGGTCLNEGCIPTKALVKAAETYQEILHAEEKGIYIENPSFDMDKIIDNKNEIKEKLVTGIEYLLEKYKVKTIQGHASFISDLTVKISGEEDLEIEAKDIIIATGSKTKHLPIPGIDGSLVIDSEVLLENRKLPQTMIIIGGGIIGMEFAFIYASFGVKINVIEFLPRVLPGVDKEFSARLARFLKQLDITVYNNATVTKVSEFNHKATVTFEMKGKEMSLESDLVLEAVGRIPNLTGLGLENTGIEYDERKGIIVDKRMKTNVDHLYAIGDVTNILQLAHVASHQGMVAIDNIIGHERFMDYDAVPGVIFTMPQIATVGKTEEICQTEGIDYEVVKVPFSANGKTLILDAEAGYLKLIRNRESKRLIGGMVFGKEAENLIAPITVAIRNGLTAEDVAETIFAHPTVMELIHEGALGLDKTAIHFVD